jgi:hypothetical protein
VINAGYKKPLFDDPNSPWDLNTGFAIGDLAMTAPGADEVLNTTIPLASPLFSTTTAAAAGIAITQASPASVLETSGNVTFNLEFDAAAMAAPAAFRTQIENAASLLASKISMRNVSTINISVQYNENNIPPGGADGGPSTGVTYSYSLVQSHLVANARAGDTNFNDLPTGPIDQTFSQVTVWNAERKALGLLSGSSTALDGSVDFSSSISTSSLLSVAVHELAHALGRTTNATVPDIFELFRYTSPGVILVDGATPATQASYLSVDGGTTRIADYGVKSDPSDFLNAYAINGDVSSLLTPEDAFNQYYDASTLQTLTAADLTQLDVLGFRTAGSAACYCPGTLITTDRGEVAVEDLRPGMRVVTAAGQERPVRWIGWRRMDFTRHPDLAAARPIRILADAFDHAVPRNDLLLSPDHAVFINGLLIPAKLLVNGMTIRREETCESTTYYHVELDSHDVLLTEGLTTESYLDTGNRGMFENGQGVVTLHPLFDYRDDQDRREAESVAPFAADAARVAPEWNALADRARTLGFVPPARTVTDKPTFRVERAGAALKPVVASATRHVVVVPAGTGSLRLISRADTPAATHPWIDDHRRLGVRVSRLTLRSGEAVTRIPMDDPGLSHGWWQVESDAARWTSGAAELLLRLDRPAMLEIEFVAMPAYRLPSTPEEAEFRAAA